MHAHLLHSRANTLDFLRILGPSGFTYQKSRNFELKFCSFLHGGWVPYQVGTSMTQELLF